MKGKWFLGLFVAKHSRYLTQAKNKSLQNNINKKIIKVSKPSSS
jgi:hypothetical protein